MVCSSEPDVAPASDGTLNGYRYANRIRAFPYTSEICPIAVYSSSGRRAGRHIRAVTGRDRITPGKRLGRYD